MKKRIVLGAAFAALVIGAALAAAPTYYQTGTNVLTTLNGAERIAIDNGYGGNAVATVNTVRNAQGYLLSAATSGTVSTWTATAANLLLTGNVGTATTNLPASPPDGFEAGVCNAYGTNY